MKIFLGTAILGAISITGVWAQDTAQPAPAATTHKKSTIHKRRVDQRKRIGEGIESGQLTPAEAARLENKDRKINSEIRDDREDHGGKLTAAEKKKINRQQNKVSKDIYKEKHDAQKQ